MASHSQTHRHTQSHRQTHSKAAVAVALLLVLLALACPPPASSIRVSGSTSGLDALHADFERFAVRSSRGRLARRGGGRALLQSEVLSCNGNTTLCGSLCTNTDFDSYNCGRCNNYCATEQDCCGGTCTDLQTDVNNCGTCGTICEIGECEAGVCSYGVPGSSPPSRR